MSKKTSSLLFVVLLCFPFVLKAQKFGLKTNSVQWATLAPNLGVEMALSRKLTLDISGAFAPVKLSGHKYFNYWIAQPELRYWFCESFNGHFLGLHLIGTQYNAGNINIPIGRLKILKDHRYEGYGAGGGLTYGHQWMFASRWGIEAALGVGYVYLDYKKFPCGHCGTLLKKDATNYFGVTKAALSVIYFIK